MTLGSDFAGGHDLDSALGEANGLRALADSIIRRLTTTMGELEDHPAYGFSLTSLIGTTLVESFVRQQIIAQIFEEEEVEDATIVITALDGSLNIQIVVFAPDGEFPLTINVSELGVETIIPADL